MAKKKKPTFLKKFLIVAIVLVIVQVGLIAFFRTQQNATTFVESAEEAINQVGGITDRRVAQAKVQMAILAYKKENGGLPTVLNDLKPKYLESIPNDPETQKPFTYQVDGDRFYVGKTVPTKTEQGTPDGLETTSPEQANFVYDSTGERDPLRPFDIAPKADDATKTPLERFDLGQFKLTAVLSSENPSATVELADGKGFIVRKGTKIGLNGGEIIDIKPDRLIILETKIDFTGQKTQQTQELMLRTANQKNNPDSPGDGTTLHLLWLTAIKCSKTNGLRNMTIKHLTLMFKICNCSGNA